jgi:hypothetical protein
VIDYFTPKALSEIIEICVLLFLTELKTADDIFAVESDVAIKGAGHSVRRVLNSLDGKDAVIKSKFVWLHNITTENTSGLNNENYGNDVNCATNASRGGSAVNQRFYFVPIRNLR